MPIEERYTLKQTISIVIPTVDDVIKKSLYILIRPKWRYFYMKHNPEHENPQRPRTLPASLAVTYVKRLIPWAVSYWNSKITNVCTSETATATAAAANHMFPSVGDAESRNVDIDNLHDANVSDAESVC